MNKASAELMELALSGRGRELALSLAISRLCDDAEHMFRSDLSREDRKNIKLLARLAVALLTREFKVKSFSSSLRRGQWAKALDAVEEIATDCGLSKVETFNGLVAILLVPVCFVDHFTLAILDHVRIADVATSARLINPALTFKPLCNSWVRRLTRESFISFVTCALVLQSRDPSLLEVVDNEADRIRFLRLQKVLQLIAEHSDAYAEVMSLVNLESWREADLVAHNYLSQIGVGVGQSFDEPPALADFLVVAMTLFWSEEDISRARSSPNWK